MTSDPYTQKCHDAALLAATWWGERLKQGDRKRFEEYITEAVAKELLERGEAFLDCDHDPQGIILDAVRSAGVECSGHGFSAAGILPTKHSLYVYPSELIPKEGYGNLTEVIPVS